MKLRRAVIVAALVAVILLVATFIFADRWLTATAQRWAVTWGNEIGRPVHVASVKLQLRGGLSLALNQLSVGPASGESVPLLTLDKAEVNVALIQALRSSGREITIYNLVFDAPKIAIERRSDGLTNAEQLVQQVTKETAKPAEESRGFPQIHLTRATLTGGEMRLVQAGSRDLTVSDVNLTVKDASPGLPLRVLASAALLGKAKNFDLEMVSAPIPNDWSIVPTELKAKLAKIDLAPIAPFLPRTVGLAGGTVEANLDMVLGAVVPGGSGETRLKGTLNAWGLRSRQAPTAPPQDVALALDLGANVARGDLSIEKLRLDAVNAHLTGKGKILGALGKAPRMDGLFLEAKNLDLLVVGQFVPGLREQLQGLLNGPIDVSVVGSGTAESPSLTLKADLTRAAMQMPKQFSKARGAPLTIDALARASGGKWTVEADLNLQGVDLRPGETFNKSPGERLAVKWNGTVLNAQEGWAFTFAPLQIEALADAIRWEGSASLQPDLHFNLSGKSAHLDVDRLLLSTESNEAPNPGKFHGMAGQVAMQIGQVRVKKVALSNLDFKARFQENLLTIDTLSAQAFGGTLTAKETTYRLADPRSPFAVQARTQGVEIAQALEGRVDKKTLSGKLESEINLRGDASSLEKTLTGKILGQLLDGVFYGSDIFGSLALPVIEAVPKLKAVTPSEVTSLGKALPFAIEFQNGQANLKNPLKVSTTQGNLTLSGGFSVDGTLALKGGAELAPALLSKMTAGSITLDQPLPLSLKIGGPAWSPKVEGLDFKPAVTVLAKAAALSLAKQVLGNKFGDQTEKIGAIIDDPKKAAEDMARAELEKQKAAAEKRAQEEVERLKNKAKGEVKSRLGDFFK